MPDAALSPAPLRGLSAIDSTSRGRHRDDELRRLHHGAELELKPTDSRCDACVRFHAGRYVVVKRGGSIYTLSTFELCPPTSCSNTENFSNASPSRQNGRASFSDRGYCG